MPCCSNPWLHALHHPVQPSVASSWKGTQGIPGKVVGKNAQVKAGVLRSKGCFFASRTTFSHTSGLFLRGFLSRKNPRVFLKSHRFCRTEGLQKPNCARHSRLNFQWSSKSLIIPILKAYERKWPKMLSGENARYFLMSRNAIKCSVLRPQSKT